MPIQSQTSLPARHSLRNLMLFIASIVILPWLGWALDTGRGADPHNQNGSLGWLFFIASPLLAVLLLRSLGGDGWKDFGLWPQFKRNGQWYLFAFLFHPLSMTLVTLVGSALGLIRLAALPASQLLLLGGTLLGLSLPSFIKNIFEEFAWRGYLTPKMQRLVPNQLLGHGLVGLIWFTWHLPYYMVLMSPANLHKATSLGLAPLLFMTLLGILPTALLYGELRFRTDSVWPAVLIHTCGNVFFDALILQNIFSLPGPVSEALFSPAMFSLVVIVITTLAGLWLYRGRMKAEKMLKGANLA